VGLSWVILGGYGRILGEVDATCWVADLLQFWVLEKRLGSGVL
jgi:hypothetical protein